MIRRIIRSVFNATHAVQLPDGPEAIHGHDWRVQFEYDVPDRAADHKEISEALERVLEPMRHAYLNDIEALRSFGATAESVAYYIFENLTNILNDVAIRPFAVELEEEPGCRARYEKG